jgi:hypothetical protein
MATVFRGRHENREEGPAEHERRNGHLLPGIESEFRELVQRNIPRLRAESGNGARQPCGPPHPSPRRQGYLHQYQPGPCHPSG